MTYLFDTNICIYAIKNKPEHVLRRIKTHLADGLFISSITLAELVHGTQNSRAPERNTVSLLQFLAIFEVLDFDDRAAMEYGRIAADLQRKGMRISHMDMLIAGHALASSKTLVTNNVREFERVTSLTIENWAA